MKKQNLKEVRIAIEYKDGYRQQHDIRTKSGLNKLEKDTGILGKLCREEIEHP